jgi:hypothetical protein
MPLVLERVIFDTGAPSGIDPKGTRDALDIEVVMRPSDEVVKRPSDTNRFRFVDAV